MAVDAFSHSSAAMTNEPGEIPSVTIASPERHPAILDVDHLDDGVTVWSAALDAKEEPLSETSSRSTANSDSRLGRRKGPRCARPPARVLAELRAAPPRTVLIRASPGRGRAGRRRCGWWRRACGWPRTGSCARCRRTGAGARRCRRWTARRRPGVGLGVPGR